MCKVLVQPGAMNQLQQPLQLPNTSRAAGERGVIAPLGVVLRGSMCLVPRWALMQQWVLKIAVACFFVPEPNHDTHKPGSRLVSGASSLYYQLV